MTSGKSRSDELNDKHVIYIEECRPSVIVQYEQHILQKSIKMERKDNEKYYKLGDIGSMDSSLLRSQALTFTTNRRKRTFTDRRKAIYFCHSLGLGLFRPLGLWLVYLDV